MKSYYELIKDDNFDTKNEYVIDTDVYKLCWGCEKKSKSGHMVWNTSKTRRIFFCDECFNNLKDRFTK